ncbi:LLM class flavin-dependent oxidoreductase [Candidatus Protofrankia californiensis]|uniref:LLM class flavin-dependent oxidoreductase n=1 Tax=Candidatus Protofrankia californiensis TaxID=1839754 RepID=UPI0019CF9220|nr:LLM class flavin-dependent oxidoreductase [Candidatus Protofrankia californiensis]
MSNDNVRFGVNLMPQTWVDQPVKSGAALLTHRSRLFSRMAQAGIDHVMVGDHVMFHGGVGNDGLTDAASVVTATDELDVYLAVYLMVLRHPLLVARQILTVAQFAPGRLSLGLGIGGDDRREVIACGVDPKTRGRRMDESLSIVRRLLAGETVSYEGEFFSLDEARLQPTPEQPIPLVVGGRSNAALRRAGRLGDGWLGIWTSAARCAEAIDAVEEHAADVGRTDVDWKHGMTFWCGFGSDRAEARSRVAPAMEGLYRTPFDKFESYVPYGTPEDVAEFVAPFIEAGCTTFNFIPFAGSDEAGIDAVADTRKLLQGGS